MLFLGGDDMGAGIICVEGYKAFRGSMEIVTMSGMTIRGEWLYRPDTDCWYCGGYSYPAVCCRIMEVE